MKAVHLAYPDRAPPDARIEDPLQLYTTSKLCNVLCAYELARQFQAKGKSVAVYAIDPGVMPGTGLYRGRSALLRASMRVLAPVLSLAIDGVQLPRQSGRDIVRLLTDPELRGRTGLYFDCGNEARSSEDSYDRLKAVDLWNTSAELCGLRGDETGLPIALGDREAVA